MPYDATAAGPAAAVSRASGATRLGRLAQTPAGRAARDRLAARGLLWPLVAARQAPIRSGPPSSVAERLLAAIGLTGSVRERLAGPGSDVCIEGFPRSANSYTVVAFRRWNRDARVAHHMHAAFQVRRAVRLGVPCCVLVRSPLDAVASTLVMDRERVSDDACYLSYIRFHRRVAPVREQLVVCRFEQVVKDPSIVVDRLNGRFGTSFATEPVTREAEDAMLASIRRRRPERSGLPEFLAAVPSEAKEARKEELRARLAGNPLLPEAQAAYDEMAGDGRP